jgi:hypothetical protein
MPKTTNKNHRPQNFRKKSAHPHKQMSAKPANKFIAEFL